MADAIHGIRSLPLYDLIGAPLIAMIRAETEAAKASLEFIETVGFVPVAGEAGPAGESVQAGRLRMAEFRYKKLDENNEVAEFVASVPLLSLVPIPALQIKEGKISFSAKITEVTKEDEGRAAPPADTATAVRGLPLLEQLRARKVTLFTKPATTSGPKGQEVKGAYDLDIQVTVGQADIPLGLEKILNMMDQAIQDTRARQPS